MEFVCELDDSKYLTRRKSDLYYGVTKVGQNSFDMLSPTDLDTIISATSDST